MTCKGDGIDDVWDGEEWQKCACSGCGACSPSNQIELLNEHGQELLEPKHMDNPHIRAAYDVQAALYAQPQPDNDEYFARGARNLAAALNDSIDFHTRSLQRMADEMNKQNIKPNRKDRRKWRRNHGL